MNKVSGKKKIGPTEGALHHSACQFTFSFLVGLIPHAVHDLGSAGEKKACIVCGVIIVSLSVFQSIMELVWLIYPACWQHYPDSHTDLRSKKGRYTATRVGLIKFIPTNKGMTYPIIQPGEQSHCFPMPAREHANLIIVAYLASITVQVVAEAACYVGGRVRTVVD